MSTKHAHACKPLYVRVGAHVSCSQVKDERIRAKDLRLRFEIGGADPATVAAVKIELPNAAQTTTAQVSHSEGNRNDMSDSSQGRTPMDWASCIIRSWAEATPPWGQREKGLTMTTGDTRRLSRIGAVSALEHRTKPSSQSLARVHSLRTLRGGAHNPVPQRDRQ